MNFSARLLFAIIFLPITFSVWGQNITPKPTAYSVSNAVTPKPRPTALRNVNLTMQRIIDARVEAIGGNRIVFSDDTTTLNNRRFYYWEPGSKQLLDTQEDGLPGSVQISKDGRYMIFLHDETAAAGGRDIDGDGVRQTILRMYHFGTRQVVNIDAPARSATPLPGETRSDFQINLLDNTLAYSASTGTTNTSRESDAPWHIVDMLNLVYLIEGTPTPTPTPTPPTTSLTPTPTPSLSARTDVNQDGKVDALDLLWMQLYWQTATSN
ncbi:hypothetical protein K8I31_02300 [bacterium]|nr:hypothetical protein [bacterium]